MKFNPGDLIVHSYTGKQYTVRAPSLATGYYLETTGEAGIHYSDRQAVDSEFLLVSKSGSTAGKEFSVLELSRDIRQAANSQCDHSWRKSASEPGKTRWCALCGERK